MAGSQTWDEVIPELEPYDHETLSVSSTVVRLTPARYNPVTGSAAYATVTVESAPVRFWDDGTDPTPTQGQVLQPGDILEAFGAKTISKIGFVATSGTAVLQISYWK